jgi:UDP-glucose 4-epimerase
MTVLGTGGAGYIGSHMVHALVDAGERVVVLDNLTTGFDWAVAPGASLLIGDTGDQSRVAELIAEHRVDAVIHFAAASVVPDSVRDPLGYYRNNTVNSRALIETAVKQGVHHFIFSSTAAVYGNPERVPAREDDPTVPTSPYGSSKRMTEIMLRDAGAAHGLRYMILRYFNVAGADPLGRTGQSTKGASHLIKVAVETALELRPKLGVFGTDYPTSDGTCIRDYIHVSDLVAAHGDALAYLRAGGASTTLNCGYGRGFSVLEVVDTVKRVSGVDFKVELTDRRPGDPAEVVAACDRIRSTLKWQPRFDESGNHRQPRAGMGAQAFETYWLTASPPSPLESLRSLHCDRLGEVARLVDVGAHHDGRVVGDQLHRDSIHERRHRGRHGGQRELG